WLVGNYRPAEVRQCRALSRHSAAALLQLVNIQQETDSLPVGAHLISPRKLYMHHGIYLGQGEIAHYSGFSSSLKPGPVVVTSIERFAHNKPVWLLQERPAYSSAEIVARARSRVGENRYKVISNNCEHFCNWCIRGQNYSLQIDAYLHCPRHFFSFISALKLHFIA
ncbi:MAG TPA: lecithin retinol acyltransferase family protein, partial [Pseudomonas sp.]|nr:lecithin retinol acyltransferase family protein [Pseudomonas sp.]